MPIEFSERHIYNLPQNSEEITRQASSNPKLPRSILKGIFAFPPNRHTLGGTAYLIVKKSGNILIDCPDWNETNRQFLLDRGGVKWLFITHRGAIGKNTEKMPAEMGLEVVIQEQEAYLLPEAKITSFTQEFIFSNDCYGIWTCGHSPGSSCLYLQEHGGVLFSGRHLLPKSIETIAPLRIAKTFHWFRQLRSVEYLRLRFSSKDLNYILPGANTGFLRGQGYIDRAYERLLQLDLSSLKSEI